MCEIASFCSNDELTKIFYDFIQINYDISTSFLNKTKSNGWFLFFFTILVLLIKKEMAQFPTHYLLVDSMLQFIKPQVRYIQQNEIHKNISSPHFKQKQCFLFYQKYVHFILKKMQFCICFLKMFRPLKGWYVLI